VLQHAPSLTGLHVLIVDDDEADARELLKTVIEQRGAHVTAVMSAAEALNVLQRDKVDVLVRDISMPGEDGYSLIRPTRATAGVGARLPAVALTALGRAEDRARVMLAGFQIHVPKPVEATSSPQSQTSRASWRARQQPQEVADRSTPPSSGP
jgi:CheY-like chemotaxis protein